MAITTHENHVDWTGPADSDSVAAGGSEESLEFNLDATCVQAQIALKADNNGTPASGDYVDFFLLQTLGDPDDSTSGTDEFSTTNHSIHLARLDTNEDEPAIAVVPLPMPFKGGKLRAENNAASNGITVSAVAYEQRSA